LKSIDELNNGIFGVIGRRLSMMQRFLNRYEQVRTGTNDLIDVVKKAELPVLAMIAF
jgi:hypothetical protein